MSSPKQIEANRRNALESTGPKTDAGKCVSRTNAVRHGLTAETVIGALEDAEDYKAFEAAVTADYDAQSAVERELVLRLTSLLWRLRRATSIETGLFEIQAEHLQDYAQSRRLLPYPQDRIRPVLSRPDPSGGGAGAGYRNPLEKIHVVASSDIQSDGPARAMAQCFLRLANLPNFALDRLSRYEVVLWRQVAQTLFALDALDRRKPQERGHHFPF